MRISDWSSDVCTSNLRELGGDESVLDTVREGQVPFAGDDDSARHPHLVVCLGLLGQVFVEKIGCRPSALLLLRLAQPFLDPTVCKEIGTLPVLQHVSGGREVHERYEEHTSELQSLLRTSTAVFCLNQ